MSGHKKYISDLPHLMNEWNWERNNVLNIFPDGVSYGSIKKIWWKCDKGHEWEATPNNRSRGQGCPICAGRKVLIVYNDLTTTRPQIVKEWNYARNIHITPESVTEHSHHKVWWKCSKCGNEWESTIYNRAAGKGCPICSKKKQGQAKVENIIKTTGSFAENHPSLIEEWDYEKNTISPFSISKSSTSKVWWKCKRCGYSWQTTVSHRTLRNHGCPACINHVVTKNNSLVATYPQILDMWNYAKNTDISPEKVTAGSNKKVWWICELGHEWMATVSAIKNGGKCPVCCGQKVQEGFNDLNTVNPLVAKEWHPTKNKYSPTEITAGSSKEKVWWVCPKGHEYQSTVANRTKGSGCPVCDKKSKTSFPEQAIFYYLKRVTNAYNRYLFDNKTEIDVFLPDYNIGIEYDGYYFHNNKKSIEKEERKNSILKNAGITLIRVKETKEEKFSDTDRIVYIRNNGYSSIQDMIERLVFKLRNIVDIGVGIDVDIERDSSDIYSQYIESEKSNSLACLRPDLAKEWHPTKNGFVKPDMISVSSGKKVWWFGSCGHEWQMSVENRSKGSSCPYCSGKRVLKGYNDLSTTHPQIANEWDYDKNTLKPDEVSHGSDKKVWWICSNGHSFQATVSNRVIGRQCPTCSIENRSIVRDTNRIAKKGSLKDTHPLLSAEWDKEMNQDLTPDKVTSGSDKKVWWVCSKGHKYQASVSNRVYGKGCPICAGKKIVSGLNDLVTVNPQLASEWDYSVNSIDPQTISPNSHKKAYWICSICNHKWQAQIKSRNLGSGCPKCARTKKNKQHH